MSADKTPLLADKLPGYEAPSALHSLLECLCVDVRKIPLVAKHGVRVLPEYSGDLLNGLNSVLNKKLALLIMVGFESAGKGDTSLLCTLRNVNVVFNVYESVLMNQSASGTRVSALVFAERIITRIIGYVPAATNALPHPSPVTPAEENTLRLNPEESRPDAGMICYTIRATTSVCLCTDDE